MNDLTYQIGKLQLAPTDILVVKTKAVLTAEIAARLKGHVTEILKSAGLDNEVMVLTSGLDLQVIQGGKPDAL